MKERNATLEKTVRKESFFEQIQETKRARKPFDALQSFQSKLNEFNLTSRGEHKAFTLEKSAEFIGSEVLYMGSGLVKMISTNA